MPQLIHSFSHGGKIEFDQGCFDKWCVYLTPKHGKRYAPKDTEYFSRLKTLSRKHSPQMIYDDFVTIYNRTEKHIDKQVLILIHALCASYNSDSAEMEVWFNVLYAGMIAEENKEKAILKKRIKRLGMHQLLVQDYTPLKAATFSKGKNWKELDKIMQAFGF